MNTDKILIYGERLGDLKEARMQLDRMSAHPTTEAIIAAAPFVRALGRARAEVLLELADCGGTAIMWPDVELRACAAARVLLEMREVDADPLVLPSHPVLAAATRGPQETHV